MLKSVWPLVAYQKKYETTSFIIVLIVVPLPILAFNLRFLASVIV